MLAININVLSLWAENEITRKQRTQLVIQNECESVSQVASPSKFNGLHTLKTTILSFG